RALDPARRGERDAHVGVAGLRGRALGVELLVGPAGAMRPQAIRAGRQAVHREAAAAVGGRAGEARHADVLDRGAAAEDVADRRDLRLRDGLAVAVDDDARDRAADV